MAIDCRDVERLASFWGEALNYVRATPPSGFTSWDELSQSAAVAGGEAWSKLVDPAGIGPPLLFHSVPEQKVVKNRVHLDIRLQPGEPKERARVAVDAEVDRLTALGATHLRTDEDEVDYYAVMQDPEGNEFCIG